MAISIVTGGAGFIGSHVAGELLKLGHQVVVLDDLSGGSADNVPDGALFVEGSILDAGLIDTLFRKYSFDYVFHLAAYAAEGLSHFIRRFNYTNNLIGSVNLINASVNFNVKCFVFTSSIAVYGSAPLPMREDMRPQPEDPYGIAKFAVECDLHATEKLFGLRYIIFRPHNVYGEYQNIGDRYRNVIGIFMNQIMRGQPLSIFGDGEQKRAFTYIGDIAPVIAGSINVPEAYGEVFNIGADNAYSVNELARAAGKAMGAEIAIKYLDARQEVVNAWSDHSKVQRIFGVRKQTSLDEGLERMATWARSAGARKSKRFEGIEISRNLPPFWANQLEG